MNNKLKTKDLVSIGVFFVIYFVLFMAIGMLGAIPVVLPAVPFIASIILGTVVMLFMAKVPKPWALFIFGILYPLAMMAAGHTFIVLIVGVISVGLAELFFRKGGFKSFKYNAISYACLSCWITGSIMQLYFAFDQYKAMHGDTLSPEYWEAVKSFATLPMMALIVVGAFVGGLIGAYIGKLMLKKHFEKAGIV